MASSLRHDGDLSIRQLGRKMEHILQSVNYSPTLKNDVSEDDVDDVSSAQEYMNQYEDRFCIGIPHQTPAASPSGFPLFSGNQQLNRFSMTPQFTLTQWPPMYQTATPLNYNPIFARVRLQYPHLNTRSHPSAMAASTDPHFKSISPASSLILVSISLEPGYLKMLHPSHPICTEGPISSSNYSLSRGNRILRDPHIHVQNRYFHLVIAPGKSVKARRSQSGRGVL